MPRSKDVSETSIQMGRSCATSHHMSGSRTQHSSTAMTAVLRGITTELSIPTCSPILTDCVHSVGYHSDQLTYLGPRAVIGSLSLGVAREFRVRKVVPREDDADAKDSTKKSDGLRADAEGQISIHLPHNSLLVMHAEMQEEWKHSIAPAQAIDPHPIAKNKRINITYRCYKESFHPRYTPKCKCGVPTVLRCVQRKRENRGRYMWMCHTNYTPGKEG